MVAQYFDLPITKDIFDVVAGSIDEHSMFIPSSALQSHVLIDGTQALELTIADTQS